jgi:ubiquinone/menaquinone biosynthesis C-methylase UbiE
MQKNATSDLGELIIGMRQAFMRGENAMQYARDQIGDDHNTLAATLIAYDLQAGSYVDIARKEPALKKRWALQLVEALSPFTTPNSSLLEVGVGEATTLTEVIKLLPLKRALGFDISWSRCHVGKSWLQESDVKADLFVGDIFNIPLADESIDVLYTSHSLEPNGGKEKEAISELCRVAKKAVVLVEPIFELASDEAKLRMTSHGYVKGLARVARELGFNATDPILLNFSPNLLNPSGVVIIEKNKDNNSNESARKDIAWRCPITKLPLTHLNDVLFQPDSGLAYPVLKGVPLLCHNYAIVASALDTK